MGRRRLPAFFHHGPRVVVVDAFVVLGGDAEGADGFVFSGEHASISHHIFDKNGVVESPFGDGFFVRAFEHAIEFTTGGGFREADQVVRPKSRGGGDGEGQTAALVMSAALADGFGTRTEGGDGHLHGGEELGSPAYDGGFPRDLIVEESGLGADGGVFFDKPRQR